MAMLVLLGAVTATAQAPNWERLTTSGMQAFRDGRYDVAAQQLQAALAVTNTLSQHDPRVASSLMNLATLYHAQKQYAQAAPLYERALRLREQSLGEAHPQVADVLEAYANLLHQQHPWRSGFPWSAAAKMAARAKRIRRQERGTEKRPVEPESTEQWRWPQDEEELFDDSQA